MRSPILNDVVNNLEKRNKGSISTERAYDGLAFIIESREENPGETKKENEAIEKQEGDGEADFGIFVSSIKPKDLEEGDEGDKGKACIKGQSEREGGWDEVSSF
jgi:hypothetical protein